MTRQPRPGPGGGRVPRRPGRRAGESGTRGAILAAARAQFAGRGYDGATIRAIAAAAAVDPALVHHFYGSKERLFVAAMRLPVVPSQVLTAALAPGGRDPAVSLGVHLVRTMLGVWEREDVRGPFLGLLRSALTSEQAAGMLREFITEAILGPVAAAAAGDRAGDRAGDSAAATAADGGESAGGAGDSGGAGGPGAAVGPGAAAAAGPGQAPLEFRAALAASQMLGLALTRYVLALGPVAAASVDDLAAAIGPTLERYLAGDVRARR
ncbi:MAG TPA: TetR family transcriptional regulator [Streptosporangiaceae bacterium]|nr:TetR family transcriptional regulator [Streptosporangiaceae bacterium]